ncbi:MAG: hypothetical protein RL291_1468 [Pseudomonadota bacterium]|jgi:ribosome-associated heat shock protein Hsp15
MPADANLKAPSATPQRVDQWLFFSRVVKSRTLAANLVTDGKVRLNRDRLQKPSATVKPGDVLTLTLPTTVRVLKVLGSGERRGPAPEAQQLYEDLAPREAKQAPDPSAPIEPQRAPGSGRPTKKDRRALDRLQGGDQ